MYKLNLDGLLISISIFLILWTPVELLPIFAALEDSFKLAISLITLTVCLGLGFRLAKKYGHKKLNSLFLQPYTRIPLTILVPVLLGIGITLRMPEVEAPKWKDEDSRNLKSDCDIFDQRIEKALDKNQDLLPPSISLKTLELHFPGCKVSESIRERFQEAEIKWRDKNNKFEDSQSIADQDIDKIILPEQDTEKLSNIPPPSYKDDFSEKNVNRIDNNNSLSAEDIDGILDAGKGESSTTTRETYRKAYRRKPTFIQDIFGLLGGGLGSAFGTKTTTVNKIVQSTSTTTYDKSSVIKQLQDQFKNLEKGQAQELRKALIASLLNQRQDGNLSEGDAQDILDAIDDFLDNNNPETSDGNAKQDAYAADACKALIEGRTFETGTRIPVSISNEIIKCLKERVTDSLTRDEYEEIVKGVTER